MDINELNKMNVIAQFTKLASQTNFVGSDEESFAGLLEKNTSVKSFAAEGKTVEGKVDGKDTANDKIKDKDGNKEKINKTENKSEKAQKSEDKTSEDSDVAEKKDEPVEKGDEAQKEETKKNKAKKSASSDAVSYAAEANVDVSKTKVEKAVSEGNISFSADLMSDILSGKLQVLTEEGISLSPAELTIENLSKQNTLQIVNPQTMETVQISGDLLSQKLQQMQEALSTDVAEFSQFAENMQSQIQANNQNQTARNKAEQVLDTENVSEVLSDIDGEKEIAEMLSDKSVKVELNIKEEKISYLDNKKLVKDSFVLQEYADAQDEISNAETIMSQPKGQSAQGSKVANMAMMQNPTIVNDEKPINQQSMNIGEVKQVSSANMSNQSVMSGAEFLASAKAEQAGKNNQTSLNDVYKGMSKEAVEQVKVNITKSAVKGVDTIEVRLQPEELGHIEIKMQIKGGKLQAHIISSRPETMEALQKDAQILEKAFNDAGFQTDSNSLSFSFRNEGNQAQEQSSKLRDFIGEVFEQEAQSDEKIAEAANQNWSAERGLNIRV